MDQLVSARGFAGVVIMKAFYGYLYPLVTGLWGKEQPMFDSMIKITGVYAKFQPDPFVGVKR